MTSRSRRVSASARSKLPPSSSSNTPPISQIWFLASSPLSGKWNKGLLPSASMWTSSRRPGRGSSELLLLSSLPTPSYDGLMVEKSV